MIEHATTAYKGQDVYKDAGENILFATLEFNRKDQKKEREIFEDLCSRFPAILRSMRIRANEADLKASMGISDKAWGWLYPEVKKPKDLFVMPEVKGPKYTSPSTDADILFHIRANKAAVVHEVLAQAMLFIQEATTTIDETSGFRYFEGRAIIGFIDGTENPIPGEDIEDALITDEDEKYINGSYAFVQKYIHNMKAWDALSTAEQELAIGRRKYTDLELDDDAKLPNSHNVASKDEEKKIIRMNVPYSSPSQSIFGTYFIGYSRDPKITRTMLTNMFQKNDRLLDFSTPTTGTLFFIPSLEILDGMASGEFK